MKAPKLSVQTLTVLYNNLLDQCSIPATFYRDAIWSVIEQVPEDQRPANLISLHQQITKPSDFKLAEQLYDAAVALIPALSQADTLNPYQRHVDIHSVFKYVVDKQAIIQQLDDTDLGRCDPYELRDKREDAEAVLARQFPECAHLLGMLFSFYDNVYDLSDPETVFRSRKQALSPDYKALFKCFYCFDNLGRTLAFDSPVSVNEPPKVIYRI